MKAEYCGGDVKACDLKFSLLYPGCPRADFDITVFLDNAYTMANYPLPSSATGFRLQTVVHCILEDIVGPVCPASTVVGSGHAIAMRTVRSALDALRRPSPPPAPAAAAAPSL